MANSKKQKAVINEELIATITSSIVDAIRLQGMTAETMIDKPKKLDVMELMKLKNPIKHGRNKHNYACSRCGRTFQTAKGFSNDYGTGHKQKNWCKSNKKAVSALVKKGAKIVSA
tara:strand:+ start:233 stop:577 length:345 start_codon:yes stop_codon:yes gene_type:complete